ncbi:MAG: glycine--tRNA ligase [Candidatus Nezhaarchaeales archaeon]
MAWGLSMSRSVAVSLHDKVVELAKRRGFFWPSSEIYGGVAGFLDLGPLGTSMKRKIVERWREWFVLRHQDFITEIETPIVMPSKVFEASGHVDHFTDFIVECSSCHRKFRADHLIEEQTGIKGLEGLKPFELDRLIEEYGVKCSDCGSKLGNVKTFNLLFKTFIGPYSENVAYARPEAAQGMFTTFQRVYKVMREKLPLGIAQIGKVLRNEVSPRQGPIRLREFTIMEVELFFDPEDPSCHLLDRVANETLRLLVEEDVAMKRSEPRLVTVREALDKKLIVNEWNAYFMAIAKNYVASIGIPEDKQMFLAKLPAERAHYAAQVYDQVVQLDRWGWVEVSGHAYRTDYDLSGHMRMSGEDLRVFKRHDPPIITQRLTVKPVMHKLAALFKDEAERVKELLKEVDAEQLQKQLAEKGYCEVGGFKLTGDSLTFVKEEVKVTGRRFIPHVAEPSFGADRLLYAALEYAYSEREDRVILRLPKTIVPVEVTVFPLVNKDGIPEMAKRVYDDLIRNGFLVEYDDSGSIGRRYARADEVGVPLAITVDGQTLKDGTVTIRDRDTWKQVRAKINDIPRLIKEYLNGRLSFVDLGNPQPI